MPNCVLSPELASGPANPVWETDQAPFWVAICTRRLISKPNGDVLERWCRGGMVGSQAIAIERHKKAKARPSSHEKGPHKPGMTAPNSRTSCKKRVGQINRTLVDRCWRLSAETAIMALHIAWHSTAKWATALVLVRGLASRTRRLKSSRIESLACVRAGGAQGVQWPRCPAWCLRAVSEHCRS